MRVPRNAYTINASCGPALRNIFASTPIIKNVPNAINPTITQMLLIASIFMSSSSQSCQEFRLSPFISAFLRELIPRTHIRDSAFEPRNHHFSALLQWLAILAARPRAPPRAVLDVKNFARAARPNGDIYFSDRADHLKIHGLERRIRVVQHLHHERRDQGRARKSSNGRQAQHREEPKARMRGQQKSNAAKPCQKNHHGCGIEKRKMRRAVVNSVTRCRP